MDWNENIYDIRKSEQLVYIMPKTIKYREIRSEVLCKTAIAINLYYVDTLEYYIRYIKCIPEEIDVYIISSVEEVLNKMRERCFRKNIHFISKENRGRDISALLVIFVEFVQKYKFFCFLHDKKEKDKKAKSEIELWIENLWSNTVASREYIYNVISKFEEDDEIGLMVPPEPMGKRFSFMGNDLWGKNYDNTIKLAELLNICCDIDKNKPPITIGTVFWARTKAIKKLLDFNWTYEEFPSEPMFDDGEINHAIERVLGYIAQDSKFKTATIMVDEYAAKQYLYNNDMGNFLQCFIKEIFDVKNIYELELYKEQYAIVSELFKKCKKVYLYGAGELGTKLLSRMKIWGFYPEGFIVSNGHKLKQSVEGLPVLEVKDLKVDIEYGVIIAVGCKFQKEIQEELEKTGFENFVSAYL